MRRSVLLLLAAATLVAGCGEKSATLDVDASARAQAPQAPPTRLPQTVPTQPTGPAPADAMAVIRRWSRTLRAGDVIRAAEFFSLGSHAQNGTPVLVLRTPQERLAFHTTLSCGAVPTQFGGVDGWTIVTFRLVERPGGSCGRAVGAFGYVAIRVRDGEITDWYRLPDPSGSPSSGETGPSI